MECPAEAGLQEGRPHLHAGTSENHRQVPWRPVRSDIIIPSLSTDGKPRKNKEAKHLFYRYLASLPVGGPSRS